VGGKAEVTLPASVAYDLTGSTGVGCNQITMQNIRFLATGDVVFFVRELAAYNPVEIISKDGQAHNVWFIVPHQAHPSTPGSYSHGNIGFHSQDNLFKSPIQIMMYTPGELNFYNKSETNGQLYANKVNVHPKSEFKYSSIGIPGVDLSTNHAVGSYVTIEHKREVS